jgi:hypothetical protein
VREEEVEDTSDGRGQDSEEEEGHYEGEARHYEDEVVMDLLQDPHPHADTGLATSFTLL